MKEQEYEDITQLTRVRVLKSVLRELIVGESGPIMQGEYWTVAQTVRLWEERLEAAVDIEEEDGA